MSGPKPYRTINDALGAAIQTGVPLIVRRRCTPYEVAAWIAIRFLLDTTDRRSFGSREIASEMNTSSYPRVKGWIEGLTQADVLEIIGYEQIANLGEPRAIYRIPWKRIFEASLAEAEQCVAGTNRKRLAAIPSGSAFLQLPLEFPVIHGSQSPVTDGSQEPFSDESPTSVIDRSQGLLPMDHRDPDTNRIPKPSAESPPVIDRSQDDHGGESGAPVIDGSQALLPMDHRPCDPSVTLEGRKEGGKEGRNHARTRESSPGPLPIPPTPSGEWSLSAHPVDLWQSACPDYRPIDLKHLDALATAHNAPTEGYGLYWVGRAILAASLSRNIRSIKAVKAVLDRWQREASYGTDTPAYERRKERYGQRSERPDPSGDGPDRSRRSDRGQGRERPPGTGRPPRPGDRAYYERYLEGSPDSPADAE